MCRIKEHQIVVSFLIITGFALSVLALFTDVPAGGGDNYAHFNISRWAFRHPHLFLDHWGKPVFTILTAPFAQFGFNGVRIFNIVAGLLTAFLGYKLALFFDLRFSWFTIAEIIFIPLYLVMMSSGMTEILFSLFLTLSIWLFFREKYIVSALLISFLFLVRNEGLVFLLLFLAAFLVKNQYRAIPFLLTGFLLFSVIGGFFYYHDFLWLINSRPYAIDSGPSVYGSGTWYHFLINMPEYLGYLMSFLLLAGSVTVLINWVKQKFSFRGNTFLFVLLIFGSFWGYFLIHSYLWWATDTSGGLTRVMAGVIPMAAVIAVYGVDYIAKLLTSKVTTGFVVLLLSGFLVADGARYYSKVLKSDPTQLIQKQTTHWLKTSGNLKHKLVMHDPYFAFSTGVDAWDNRRIQYGFINNEMPENKLPDSTIFIWDARFSANEGRLPLDKMLKNPHFEVLQFYEPETPFIVLGGNPYMILVFRKLGNPRLTGLLTLEEIKEKFTRREIYFSEEMDFQQASENEDAEKKRIRSESDSQNWVYDVKNSEFSPVFIVTPEKLKKIKNNEVRVTADILRTGSCQPNRLLMVVSVEKEGISSHYLTADICGKVSEEGKWIASFFDFKLPADLPEGHILKIYIWNIDKINLKIDNFKVELSEVSHRL